MSLRGKAWRLLARANSERSAALETGVATDICECFLFNGDCDPDGFLPGDECNLKLPEPTCPTKICEREVEREESDIDMVRKVLYDARGVRSLFDMKISG